MPFLNVNAALKSLLEQAVELLLKTENKTNLKLDIKVIRNKFERSGDYSSNIAFVLTQTLGSTHPTSFWSEKLIGFMPKDDSIKKVEVGGDGFINFYLAPRVTALIIEELLTKDFDQGSFGMLVKEHHLEESSIARIQYAYARTCTVLRQIKEEGLFWDKNIGLKSLDLLKQNQEMRLISLINFYPEVIEATKVAGEVRQLAYYLQELANDLHNYYNVTQLLTEDESLNAAGWGLLEAVGRVLSNGLRLLDISAPESM